MNKALTWTTREGKVLYIQEMKTGHIVNAMKMLERQKHHIRYATDDDGSPVFDEYGAQLHINECNHKMKQLKRELKRREPIQWPII